MLRILAAEQNKTQQALLAEGLNARVHEVRQATACDLVRWPAPARA
jgi:hypothetical protein